MKHSASGTPHMKPVASASVEGEQKVTHVKVGSYTDSKPVSGNKVAGEVKSQTQGKSPIQSAQTDERELVQAEGHATSDTQVDAMLRQLDLSFLLKEIKGGISFVIKPQKMDASGIRFKQIPDSVKVMQKTADGSIEITGDAEAAKQVLSSLLMDLGGSRAVSLGINVVQHNMMLVDTKIAFYADSARDSGYRTVIETKHLSVNGYHSQSLGFIASSDYLHNGNSFRFGDKQVSVDPATVIQVSNPVPVIGVDTNSVTPAVTVLPSIQTTLPEPTTTTSAPSQTTSITTTTPTTTTPSTTTTLPTTPTPSPATPVVPATPVIPVLPPHVAPLQGAPTVSAFARASNEDIATTFALAHFTAAYTDPDNDALSTITIETLPANGDLKLSGVNITLGQVITAADIPNITFVPTANWHGATSFQYKASDGFGDSNTQLITINIASVNDAPDAVNDGVAVNEDATSGNLVATLVSNDTDADTAATFSITSVDTTGTVGTVSFNAGLQTLTFAADNNAHDSLAVGQSTTTSFTYTLTDNDGLTDTATVTMTINGVNDAPVLASALVDQVGRVSNPFSYTFAAGSFTDIDATDTLSYTAQWWDGAAWAALPAWLTLTSGTRTFSKAGGAGSYGFYDIRTTATDPHGAAVTDDLQMIFGNVLNDFGRATDDFIIYGSGNDSIWGGTTGNDTLVGLAGNDTLWGDTGEDVHYTGTGLDRIAFYDHTGSTVAAPDIVMDFDSANDRFIVIGFDGIGAAPAAGTTLQFSFDGTHTVVQGANGFGFKILGNHTLTAGHFLFYYNVGTAGNDTITGNSATEGIMGGDGDDVIYGGSAPSGNGRDILHGGNGNDTITGGYQSDTIYGGAGNDVFVYINPQLSYHGMTSGLADYIADFTQGEDRIELSGLAITGIVAGAASGTNAGYSYNATYDYTVISSPHAGASSYGTLAISVKGNIAFNAGDFIFSNNTTGTAGDDNLTLGAAGGLIGLDGNDTLTGSAGFDIIAGGDGNDEIFPLAGDGHLYGGAGNDTIHGNAGGAYIGGGDGDDVIYAGHSWNAGGNGNDTIYGGAASNFTLMGEAGNDVIYGEGGNDHLRGGAGSDTMEGGTGNDIFYYVTATDSGIGVGVRDVITDFTQGQDRIDITSIYSGVFNFIGTAAFTGGGTAGNEVRYTIDVPGNRTIIEIDPTTAAGYTVEIELTGQITLLAGDFLL